MKLSGDEYKKFCEALHDAFPSYKSLEMMVKFQLDLDLEKITPARGTLSEVTFELIKWAQACGELERLIKGACNQNPGNQKLQAFQHQQNLKLYWQNFSQVVEQEFPLTEASRDRLIKLQTSLQLTDREVSQIEQPIVAPKEAEYQKREQRIKEQQEAERYQTKTTATISSMPIDRRQFLKWGGLGSGGLAIALIVSQIFKGSPAISVAEPKYIPPTEGAPKAFGLPLWTVEFETLTVDQKGELLKRYPNKQAKFFKENLGNGVTLEMVKIPGGDFEMGSPEDEEGRSKDEGPQRQVKVPEFFMGKYQVTQAQYQQIMGKNPSNFKGDERPVEKVSWNDAVEFCKKLTQKTGRTYRLPSEAEWEYACRAGTTTRFHFSENISSDLANYGRNIKETTPVGKFPPNAFCLYDMHGNVWEWCQDTWHDNYKDAPKDGSAWIDNNNRSQIVLRGGSWKSNPHYCRSASRYGYKFNITGINLGFRVLCVVLLKT